MENRESTTQHEHGWVVFIFHFPFSILNSRLRRTGKLGLLSAPLLLMASALLHGGCVAVPPKPEWVFYPPPPAAPHVVHLKSGNHLNNFVAPPVSWLDVLRGGVAGPFVDTPAGVAYADGRLYLCDTALGLVHVWNLDDGQAEQIGQHGDGKLAKPVDVAVDSAGRVYVADTGRSEVLMFDPAGTVRGRFQPPDREAYRPVALTVHGQKLYVADAANHRVDVFDAVKGQHLDTLGEPGGGPGQFSYPMGVAVDSAGNVYVSDMMNRRVQVFDSRLEVVRTVGRPGDRYGDLGQPKQLALAPDATLLVADAEFARVHLFNDRGQLLMLLGNPEATPLPAGLAIARTLPPHLTRWVPDGFHADYYLFVTNTTGPARLSLYAVGREG